MQFTIMYKLTAHFATDVTALRLGEKLEDAGVAVARRVVCYGRVAATAALQLRLRLRCVCFDFSANARDDPERNFAGTERNTGLTERNASKSREVLSIRPTCISVIIML